jgi:hypothetical protein
LGAQNTFGLICGCPSGSTYKKGRALKNYTCVYSVFILTALLVICSACQAAVPPVTPTHAPIPTNTSSPETTATPRPTETEAPYIYEVTADKLNHRPADYEYLVAHLDEFVQSPSPWDTAAFHQWTDENLDPVLGRVDTRIPNVVIMGQSSGAEVATFTGVQNPRIAPIGEIPFFYFLHNGVPYPVYIFNGQLEGTEGTNMSMGVILIDGWGRMGGSQSEVMSYIYNGNGAFSNATVILNPSSFVIPDEIRALIQYTGFGNITNEAPRRTRIGFGKIDFYPLSP